MSVEITSIPTKLVHTYWYDLYKYIDSALMHSLGEVTSVQLLEMILAEKAQLWGVAREGIFIGAAVTEVVQYPNTSALRITTLGGEGMAKWVDDMGKVLEKFAKSIGASRIEAVGRKGFIRRLAPLGYRPAYTIMIKEVESDE